MPGLQHSLSLLVERYLEPLGYPKIGMATNLILIGFKGCGKTRVGRALARLLAWDFVDLDGLLERLYLSEQGEALGFREIYRKHGRDHFRDLEGRALRIALQWSQQVLALGGDPDL